MNNARYQPRGMRREQAAKHIGVSASKFDELIKAGDMPQGFNIGRCVVWDSIDLDEAFDRLKAQASNSTQSVAPSWDALIDRNASSPN